ncbi:MAG: serine/threonine protein kinase [Solirubrobacteraceae bacterium]|nr:serine/threonine protein kinase [Solirubrobacteraceae bacterium]
MSEPRPDDTIGPYRIVRAIGRGGMGAVYLAEHASLGRKVALKVVASGMADDEDFRQRFDREARLAARLEHPNVVTVYDAGVSDHGPWLAMRYVEGEDLGARLREEGSLDPVESVAIIEQVAAALDHAHLNGLVHRDVKPANVLLERSDGGRAAIGSSDGRMRALLADFGLTKDLESHDELTATGVVVGSLDYLAPERIEHARTDGRSDVYALAAMLLVMLTGDAPFPGSTAKKLLGHVSAPRPLPGERRPELAAFDDVIARGMAIDPADRYATAGELAVAARAALTATPDDAKEKHDSGPHDATVVVPRADGPSTSSATDATRQVATGALATGGRPGAGGGTAGGDRSTPGGGTSPSTGGAGGARSRRPLVIGAVIAVLVLAGGGLALALGGGGGKTVTTTVGGGTPGTDPGRTPGTDPGGTPGDPTDPDAPRLEAALRRAINEKVAATCGDTSYTNHDGGSEVYYAEITCNPDAATRLTYFLFKRFADAESYYRRGREDGITPGTAATTRGTCINPPSGEVRMQASQSDTRGIGWRNCGRISDGSRPVFEQLHHLTTDSEVGFVVVGTRNDVDWTSLQDTMNGAVTTDGVAIQ